MSDLGFLKAIIDEPEDPVHRLVFSDWLLERGSKGDESRAELLRCDGYWQIEAILARNYRFSTATIRWFVYFGVREYVASFTIPIGMVPKCSDPGCNDYAECYGNGGWWCAVPF